MTRRRSPHRAAGAPFLAFLFLSLAVRPAFAIGPGARTGAAELRLQAGWGLSENRHGARVSGGTLIGGVGRFVSDNIQAGGELHLQDLGRDLPASGAQGFVSFRFAPERSLSPWLRLHLGYGWGGRFGNALLYGASTGVQWILDGRIGLDLEFGAIQRCRQLDGEVPFTVNAYSFLRPGVSVYF